MLAGREVFPSFALLLMWGSVLAPVWSQETAGKHSTPATSSFRGTANKTIVRAVAELQESAASNSAAAASAKSSKSDARSRDECGAMDDSSLAAVEEAAVPRQIAAQAREFFERGASFYIYTNNGDVWRGRGAVEGKIRYVKNPESPHESVKAYAFTEGTGLYGERRRFGSFCEPRPVAGAHGEIRVTYNGVRRSSSKFHVTVTTLWGKALLHVVLYPGDLNTRATRNGLPGGFISNELVIPIEF